MIWAAKGWSSDLLQLDRKLFLYLNGQGSAFMDPFWLTVTQMETWLPLFFLGVLLYFYHYPPRIAALRFGSVIVLGYGVYVVMRLTKAWVGRLRPNNQPELEGLVRTLQNPQDFSFFSGHAATSFALTFFVYLQLRHRYPGLILLFVWPVLFTLSRIFVGVHYPLDLVVGSGVGLLSAYLANRLLPPDLYSSRRVQEE